MGDEVGITLSVTKPTDENERNGEEKARGIGIKLDAKHTCKSPKSSRHYRKLSRRYGAFNLELKAH